MKERIKIDEILKFCIKKIDKGLEMFPESYPRAASENNIYLSDGNGDWTTGFWVGMIWMAYELTGDEKYKKAGMWYVHDFYERIVKRFHVEHHDMGFLYMPSCVKAYELTGSEEAKEAALLAADNLAERFREKGKFIQAWGPLDKRENYRLIIDCLLNIPLLFWASKVSGEDRYRKIAEAHLLTTAEVIVRENGETYHTYFFDPETGQKDYGKTAQGFSDSSIWARGQAWGVYGFALGYKHTHNEKILAKFRTVTDVFLDKLPEDGIPAWDMIFTDTETQKDSSASAIAACGILEMSRLCELPERYMEKAVEMINALSEKCLTKDIAETSGILMHGVYSIPHNLGVDECNLWGDYYFMEACMRLKNPDWTSCWE